jgi:2-dehydropantoate 2-reductase
MGTLFAGLLVQGGHEVWLLGRRAEVVETIAEDGVTIERAGRPERTIPVRAVLSASGAGTVDLVLIFVKAYSTLQATRDALPAVGEGTVVLTLQNGLNNIETIASVVGRERVIAGVTAHGATLLSPGVTRHAGEGETSIGELDGATTPRLLRVAEALSQSGIKVDLSPCVGCLIWGKLVVNSGINALTAILKVQNGRLIETPEVRSVMAAAAREAAAVASRAGMELPYEDPVARVEEVCRLTAANRSSMLQDMDRGVRTEVDYINGAIVREGDRLGVATPVNWTLARLVQSIEGT